MAKKIKQVNKIDKEYLFGRLGFDTKTVVKNLTKEELWGMFSIMDEEDQLSLFSGVEITTQPLTIEQIDSLFIYIPESARVGVDFVELSKEDKLQLLREHTESLLPVLEKKDLMEQFLLDEKETMTKDVYKSSNLWNILISGKYNFKSGSKNVVENNPN